MRYLIYLFALLCGLGANNVARAETAASQNNLQTICINKLEIGAAQSDTILQYNIIIFNKHIFDKPLSFAATPAISLQTPIDLMDSQIE
ncbi:hypothetical protein LPB140_08130 [Sphingorhabdus lutea]|uniref:Uncharacterized protein n=1 Tax=Sphingorhabdus lutea TaxID=1913578 RepID=A0A1L3JCA2_9SPHN|nr:hypothetical protein [Sphingorhabdus lutea]APG62760.1 hypothetical protein LPB140_08130 [Sphingorhabdus lutea]